jgi:tRNA (guanine37-N1)-methyltransferase
MKRFHIITLFPEAIKPYVTSSILGRAIADRKLSVRFYNPRDFAENRFRHIDKRPYGGGPGMVIEALPVLKAVDKARGKRKTTILFFSPSGKTFDAGMAQKLARSKGDIVLIAGHYEGIDARVQKILKAQEISVGPYVLTGGELPAATVIDAVSRHLPGILGNASSVEESRVASPEVYTRPEVLKYKNKNHRVPKVLLSGNHALIEKWKGSKKKN